jgi:translation initiation factor IF-3
MDTRPQQSRDRVQLVYLNEQIKAPNIIIIDEEGQNLGTFPRRRALDMAIEKGLDLVQIRYDHENMVSTVKMVDYGKYQYQKSKDEKEKKKTQKTKVLKEIKLNYAIGDNDLALKIRKAKEFLGEKHNVKFSIKLKGREKIYASKAIEKLANIKTQLADFGKSQYEIPKQEVHGYSIILFSK